MSAHSVVSPKARIGKNAKIGDFTIIHDDVVIGDDCTIESHCVIGYPNRMAEGRPLIIGARSTIRSHSVFYQGSTFGDGLNTGHGVLVREKTTAGKRLQIGTHSDIEGDAELGDWVRLHSEVHVAKHSHIGHFVWMFPRVQFTNDPFPPSHVCLGITIEDLAVVATGVLLLPGVRIGLGGFVGAGSVVRSDVPDIHCVSGDPATVFATLARFVSFEHGLSAPWPRHFRDAYPEECYPQLDEVMSRVNAAIATHRDRAVSRGTAR